MAKEIWVAGSRDNEVALLFLADIVAAGGTIALDKDGQNVIYTPSATIPADLLSVMTADVSAGGGLSWVNALDAGTALFWNSEYAPVSGETAQAALARIRSMYAAQLPSAIALYAAKTKYIARHYQAFNAV